MTIRVLSNVYLFRLKNLIFDKENRRFCSPNPWSHWAQEKKEISRLLFVGHENQPV